MLVSALYDEAAKSYALGFSVLIVLALAGAFLISFLPKKNSSDNKLTTQH